MKKIIIPLIILIAAVGTLLAGATPTAVRYQGSLLYHGLAFTGTQTMRFLFTNSDGSSVYWDSQDLSVNVVNGSFSTLLNVSGLNWNTPPSGGYYLQISVNGQLLLPREQVLSNIYSLQAQNVDDGAISMQKLSAAVQAKINTSTGGDNLGNHIATTTLNMSNFNIANAATVTANKVAVSTFTMATGATAGYVLTCDRAGNGFWQLASSAAISGLLSSANTWTAPNTWKSTGTFSNTQTFAKGINTSTITITGGAQVAGYVLTNDGTGNGVWQANTPSSDLRNSTNTWTAPQTWLSTGTFNNTQAFAGGINSSTITVTSVSSFEDTITEDYGIFTSTIEVNGQSTFDDTLTADQGINTSTITITGGAQVAGYVLTNDGTGNGVWQANTPSSDLRNSTNTWTAPQTWLSSGTYTGTQYYNNGINTSSITISGGANSGYVLTSNANGYATWSAVVSSAGYSVNAGTATWAVSAGTAAYSAYSLNAGTSSYSVNATTATWVLNTASTTYALSAGTASWSVNAGTAAYTSYAVNAGTSAWSVNAGTAAYTSYAVNAGTAAYTTYAVNSGTSAYSAYAVNAETASYATYAVNAGTAAYASNATGSLLLEMTNLSISTGAIAASTGTFAGQIYSLGVSTGLIAVSTGAIQGSLNSVIASTGAIAAQLAGIYGTTSTWTAPQAFTSSMTVNNNLAVSGNVGIGTISPNYNLDVAGNANFSGNITVSSVTIGSQGATITTDATGENIQLPDNDLDMNNNQILNVADLQIPTGAQNGYVLMSDSSGYASWQSVTSTSGVLTAILSSTNTWTAPQSWNSTGTFNNTQTFAGGINASTITVTSVSSFEDTITEDYGIFTSTIEVNGQSTFDDTLTADQGIYTSTITIGGGQEGYILTSDASGNASWKAGANASEISAATTTLRSDLTAVIASTGAIENSLSSVIVSTGAIQTSLSAVIASTGAIQSSLSSVITSTGAIQSSLSGVITSTGAIQSSLNSVIASTGAIETSLSGVITSTGAIQSSLNSVIASTGAIQSQLTSVANSTYTMASISISTGQVTGSWAPNLMQAGVLNPSVTVGTAAWATNAGELGGNLASYYTNPANMSAGALPSTVIASSIAVNSVYPSAVSAGTYSNVIVSSLTTGTYSNVLIPAANVNAGTLGSTVIASSIAVNSVYPSAVSAGTYTGVIVSSLTTGTYSNVTIPAANVASGSLGSSVIVSSIANTTNPTLAGLTNTGNENISGTLTVTSSATFNSTAGVNGNITSTGTVTDTGETVNGNFSSTGTITASKLTVSNSSLDLGCFFTSTTGTNATSFKFTNTGGNYYFGVDSSAGTRLFNTTVNPYTFGICNESARDMVFGTNNTPRVTISSGGYVGIGTTSPATTLEVNGSAQIDSNLTVNGNEIVSGYIGAKGVNGHYYGTFFGLGGNDGNNVVEASVTPPSGATSAIISVLGNYYYNVQYSHTGYWFGTWQSGSNRIRTIASANNSAGSNQGFTVTWTGSQIQVANNGGMSYGQGGDTTISFYGP